MQPPLVDGSSSDKRVLHLNLKESDAGCSSRGAARKANETKSGAITTDFAADFGMMG